MKNGNHSKRKHSDFSASASKRWMNCPGSVALSKNAPPQVESVYAREGTEAHECLEYIVKRYKNLKKAESEALKKWPVEMVAYAVKSADHVYALRPSPCAKLLVEQRVRLSSISGRLYGTLDYAWVEDWGRLVVIDYKYGAGVAVPPVEDDGEENSQLMYYAAGICNKVGYDFESVILAVIQPRVWSEDESPVSTHETTIERIKEFETKVRDAIKVASRPGAPLCAGDHCRWCPASAQCPELSKNTMAQADIVFDVETGEIQALPESKLIPIETLPRMLSACDLLEQWIKSVRELAFNYAEGGGEIDGYKLVAKRSTRQWLPEAKAAAEKRFGESIYETEKRFLSPAQFEKKIGVAGKLFTGKYTSNVSSGYTLVAASDKRPAVENALAFDVE